MAERFDKLLSDDDSTAERLARARALLTPPKKADPAWPALAAAGFCAFSALVFVVAAFVAPPARTATPPGFTEVK